MAVSSDYDGSKVEPRIACGVIRVTDEWLQIHATERSEDASCILQDELVGMSICPPVWTFNDTEEIRRILGLEQLLPESRTSELAVISGESDEG